ncbi:GAF domain-containing protein [Curvivirga aplysinae]|uniref:GAF domain-containing protein n=1 Tax=Curvivirga aplysinae TaxID=2529852 RepID=UPI0012BCD85D|nr:GAF domain-containing protein [Curvivirga aplysinae]MTI11196.1 GAF domain-containing protein [Curvivirga aplysinae]
MEKLLNLLDQIREEDDFSVDELLETLCHTLANKLEADQISIWFFNKAKDEMHARKIFVVADNLFKDGSILLKEDCPSYFREVIENVFIVAPDFFNHHAFIDFKDRPDDRFKFKSMLDFILYKNNQAVGVVCVGTKKDYKNWSDEDISFLRNAATLTARYL